MAPQVENAAGGSATATPTSAVASGSTGGVSSGTASAAMIKAAEAASSPASAAGATQTADTSGAAGTGDPGATSGASGQPAQTGQAADPAATGGQAPENRIQAATRNARAKTIADLGQLIGMPITRESIGNIRAGLELARRLSTPEGARAFLVELNQQIGSSGGQSPVGEDVPFPDPDLISPDGKLKTHSDANISKMLDIHGNRVRAQVMNELAPILELVSQIKDERTTATSRQQANRMTTEALTHARSLPHFKDNEQDIMAKMKTFDPRMIKAVGPVGAMHIAYNAILAEKVFPSLESATEKRLRESYQRQAAGAGSGHPVQSGGDGKRPELSNVTQLAAHMERMAATP